ncbi:MAG: YciI family protein [Alphaproteobacteria bacterium]|nr:YciI family protein [Alphaproteobacteria bacterium]
MEYFFYFWDKSNSAKIRENINSKHLRFIEAYKDSIIVEGPTVSHNKKIFTGNMYMLDLPDIKNSLTFIEENPFVKSGVFKKIFVCRCQNAMQQKQWLHDADKDKDQYFLIIGHGKPGMTELRKKLLQNHRRYFIERGYQNKFIVRGPLWSPNEEEWVGSEFILKLENRKSVDTFLSEEPYTQTGLYERLEIHRWQFG